MPGMDGLSFLDILMREDPLPVVMVSSLTQRGAAVTIRALEMGAADFVAKPVQSDEVSWQAFAQDFLQKVKFAATRLARAPTVKREVLPNYTWGCKNAASIGGSTGSVQAIQQILEAFPAYCPATIVVVHMPALFTKQFAARLNTLVAPDVMEAEDGMSIRPGRVLIAPGEKHLVISNDALGLRASLEIGPKINGHMPSVDVLFDSAARSLRGDAVGVILTGMGRDGAQGLKSMSDAGAVTIAQDQATSVVYGMPAAAVALGAAGFELPINDIARNVLYHAAKSNDLQRRKQM